MKTIFSFLLISILSGLTFVHAQKKSTYTTSSIDFPFTWSNTTNDGQNLEGKVRFAPFFNLGTKLNVDFSEKAGLYAGLDIQNTGFTYYEDDYTKKKVRSYNLGIPVGIKLGDMERTYFYAGYEVEFPFAYKEKTFVNDQKTKYKTWFSNKTAIQQSFNVGIQSFRGAGLKFKYYFTNFYKQSYTESDGMGGTIQPYKDFTANIYWLSLTLDIFRGTKFIY